MKGKLVKFLAITAIVALILLFIVYYVVSTKIYDDAEKLIFDNDIISQFEIEEESKPPQELQIPDVVGNGTVPLQEHELQAPPAPSQQQKTESKDSVPGKLSQALTSEDKRKILTLIAKKLTADDINYLISLLKDGLTQDEKKRAIELAKKRFSPDEIKEIQNLYHKYKQYAN